MESIKPILEQFTEALKKDIKIVVGKRFSSSIESEVSENSLSITGSSFIPVLIYGRKPTSPNAPKGNPTFQQVIYSWIQDKGIQAKADKQGKVMNQLSLSWAISTYIHRHGDILYNYVKSGGAPKDIFSTIINQKRLDSLTNTIGAMFTQSVSSDIIKDLK